MPAGCADIRHSEIVFLLQKMQMQRSEQIHKIHFETSGSSQGRFDPRLLFNFLDASHAGL